MLILNTALYGVTVFQNRLVFMGSGSIPIDSGSNSHGFDWGFTWAVKNNIQLDIFAGKSLNDPATDFFVNMGFSMRLPQ